MYKSIWTAPDPRDGGAERTARASSNNEQGMERSARTDGNWDRDWDRDRDRDQTTQHARLAQTS